MYAIFYNNKPIYLTQTQTNFDCSKVFDIDTTSVFSVLNQLENNTLIDVCFEHKNSDYLFKKFTENFKIIEAAGGLVKNKEQDLLFIYRNGVWDLPKGKIEPNESIAQAALREVEEECSIADLKLGSFFDKTYHIYKHKEQFVFKITHWFTMYSEQKTPLTPQVEEGITQARFLDIAAQQEVLQNTYPNIKVLVKNYISTCNLL